MITYVYNINRQHRSGDMPRKVSSLTNTKMKIEVATTSLICPRHGLDSNATIVLTSFYYGSGWEVVDCCCDEFRAAIEAAVPEEFELRRERHER